MTDRDTENAGFELLTLSDVPPDPRIRQACETAYRRGFYQGAYAAVEAVEEGWGVDKLKKWMHRLLRWRYTKHKGKETFPEWPARR